QKFKTKKLTARSNRPSSREAAYKPHYAKWSIGKKQSRPIFGQIADLESNFLFQLHGTSSLN
ncbi:hypothetical protein, partial [Rhizobium paknamense]